MRQRARGRGVVLRLRRRRHGGNLPQRVTGLSFHRQQRESRRKLPNHLYPGHTQSSKRQVRIPLCRWEDDGISCQAKRKVCGPQRPTPGSQGGSGGHASVESWPPRFRSGPQLYASGGDEGTDVPSQTDERSRPRHVSDRQSERVAGPGDNDGYLRRRPQGVT